MNKEFLVKRMTEIQAALDKSTAEHQQSITNQQQLLANHNGLLGRLAEVKFMLETMGCSTDTTTTETTTTDTLTDEAA